MSRRRRPAIDTAPETVVVWMSLGFCLAMPGVLMGFGLATLPAVLVISGLVGVCWVALSLRGLRSQFRVTDARLAALSKQVERLAAGLSAHSNESGKSAPTGWFDLAGMGEGRPDDLAAATLDRSTFPRLAAGMNAAAESSARHDARTPVAPREGSRMDADAASVDALRRWKRALRTGDLPTCRLVFSALVDTTDPSNVAALRSQLMSLEDRIERSLREHFRRHLHEQDYSKMLAVGEELVRLLPHHAAAREFRQLRPQIARRAAKTSALPKPALRIVE